MKTLQEDIDDLDRMVDTGATKDAIRSQIRLISREVAALQADYSALAQAHQQQTFEKSNIASDNTKLRDENATLKNRPVRKPLGPPTYAPE